MDIKSSHFIDTFENIKIVHIIHKNKITEPWKLYNAKKTVLYYCIYKSTIYHIPLSCLYEILFKYRFLVFMSWIDAAR